jgi:hypothetical protein
MRILGIVALCAALAGCAASRQEVVARLGDHFIGQNVDALVIQFGPPTSTFKMNSGETAYVWQLTAVTDISGDRGYRCAHAVRISADRWPDHVRLSDLEPLFTCQACGRRGADIRPDWDWGTAAAR